MAQSPQTIGSAAQQANGNGFDPLNGFGAAPPVAPPMEDEQAEFFDAPLLSLDDVYIDELLTKTFESGASDLHLAVGRPPCVRLHGQIQELDEYEECASGGFAAHDLRHPDRRANPAF